MTGTYTFSDNFNASLGVGYYAYDDSATEDFWELYVGSTLTLDSGAYFTTEFYWEPDSDGFNNAYIEPIGTVGIPFLEKFERSASLVTRDMRMTAMRPTSGTRRG